VELDGSQQLSISFSLVALLFPVGFLRIVIRGTIACVIAVSWFACYLPSRRVAIDPANTLRAE